MKQKVKILAICEQMNLDFTEINLISYLIIYMAWHNMTMILSALLQKWGYNIKSAILLRQIAWKNELELQNKIGNYFT